MRITCGNLKGGVGKTTSAAFLACGLARFGRTLLVDADPYGQLLDWSQADGFPPTVIAWPVKDLARRVSGIAGDYDHLVIDTGPNHEALLRQALAVTDVLVIPCAPTLMDVERLGETFELVEEVRTMRPELEARVLFTKASATSTDLRDARDGLSAQGLASARYLGPQPRALQPGPQRYANRSGRLRRRARRAGFGAGRLMAAARRTGAAAYGQAVTRARPTQRPIAAPPAPGAVDRRKYTVRIDAGPAERFERAVLALSTEVGRKLDKSEVMRELAEALADDSKLFETIVSRLRRH